MLLSGGLGVILGTLAEIGYSSEWDCIPASFVGAPHIRNRIWILCYPNNESESSNAEHDETPGLPNVYATSGNRSLGGYLAGIGRQRESLQGNDVWVKENSPIGMGMDDEIPERMDRLRGLGNSIVPQIAEMIFRQLSG